METTTDPDFIKLYKLLAEYRKRELEQVREERDRSDNLLLSVLDDLVVIARLIKENPDGSSINAISAACDNALDKYYKLQEEWEGRK